jgi:hypothetical protein
MQPKIAGALPGCGSKTLSSNAIAAKAGMTGNS